MSNVMQMPTNLSPLTDFLFRQIGSEINLNNDVETAILVQGTFILYFTIFILSAITYKLGFARKLPILKNVVIYILLAIGSIILTILGLYLPIAESLSIIAIVLAIYRVRLHRERQNRVSDHQK
ncbi:YlaH-like family protein [Aquibacillus sp. 3ASR75-11]|uniref:YlaH-like family protein n=1 Tax=Terrihalobacillus insolitus TaxID=2950438 RepID=A0A9X3WTR4_9BACI|nr:YlaH-like family protein [Terrihalobacillus insolitus]MDC3412787.1 YlaH-like family protein [Terrihalobacillus insolitus]MDC3423736.1 YlaH-like family protein [Terrihalobacillus insolitus]